MGAEHQGGLEMPRVGNDPRSGLGGAPRPALGDDPWSGLGTGKR